MDENREAQDNVPEIFKKFLNPWAENSSSVTILCCLRAIHGVTKRQHSILKGPEAELVGN